MLNKSLGNMYPFITHTWNPIKGKCSYDCVYCYCKRFPQGELRLDEKCFKDDLGENNIIFVGSSCDMFADNILEDWIITVLRGCHRFKKNTYLFQTKNPKRFFEFFGQFPPRTILGITLETNKYNPNNISLAPSPEARARNFSKIKDYDKMVSIEPVLDFDLDVMIKWIKEIKPKFVSIGADSKGHILQEPSKEKIELLIKELLIFTDVRIKDNLKRLIK